jgi:uncharacterized protein
MGSNDQEIPNLIAFVLGGHVESVEVAIEEGADLSARDRDGGTALHNAVIEGSLPMTTILLRAGLDVDARNKNGQTPLHLASRMYQTELVDLLIKEGAEVDPQDQHGNTPLSDAVFESRGRGDVIRRLLAAAADPDLKNHHGVSPRGLALKIANFPVAQFFG